YGDPLPEGALARLGTVRFRDGNYFNATALSPDGKTLALASGTGSMRLLDVATGKEARSFRTNSGSFSSLTFSPDGKPLAGADYGTHLQLGAAAPATPPPHLSRGAGHTRLSYFFTFSGNGKYLATATENYGQGKHAAFVWDTATGKLVAEVEPLQNNNVRVA